MAAKKNENFTHIVYSPNDNELVKCKSLKEAIDMVRRWSEDDGTILNEYIADCDIEIFEVKQSLTIEEEIIRTIKINGEVVSL